MKDVSQEGTAGVAEHAEAVDREGGGRGGQETHLSAFWDPLPTVCPGSVSQAWNPPGITSCSQHSPSAWHVVGLSFTLSISLL